MGLPNFAQSASGISKKLDGLFERIEFEQLAQEHQLIIRERKITAKNFLRLCVLSGNLTSTSLAELTADLLNDNINISKQALDERFNPFAVKFLEQVIVRLLQDKLESIVKPEGFNRLTTVTIADSTRIMLPDCMQKLFPGFKRTGAWAGMKIFFEYDLKKGMVKHLDIYSANENDYQPGEMILDQLQPKELLIRDLGFYKLDSFVRITERGSCFLSRHKTGTNLYLSADADQQINLQALIRKIPSGKSRELKIHAGNKQRLACRLIIEKFDPVTAAERRRKLRQRKKEKGEAVSRERLELCSCACYITTLPEGFFPLIDIQKTYSIRWQIEIMFKAWKSIFNIDKIRPVNPYRILCFIYGKLIAILLCTTVFWAVRNMCQKSGKYLSELKGFKRLIVYLNRLVQHLLNKTPVLDTIKFIIQLLWQKAEKEKKKGKT